MTTYQGSCHCGQTRFEVDGEITGAMACNCSMCRRKGTLMWFVGREQLRLHTPDDTLATYLFNRLNFFEDLGPFAVRAGALVLMTLVFVAAATLIFGRSRYEHL